MQSMMQSFQSVQLVSKVILSVAKWPWLDLWVVLVGCIQTLTVLLSACLVLLRSSREKVSSVVSTCLTEGDKRF